MSVGNKKIWYGIGLDNTSLKNDAEKSKQILGGITTKAVNDGKKMNASYNALSKTVGLVFSTGLIAGFVRKMALVRGEFQQLEVAFTTMLGSKQRADKLMAQTIEFAAKTPFDLKGVASGTKMLLAYGSEAENVTEELGMLGNIASGLSIPLKDLVYLYGTTRTQGRLYTMDLRQFMGRGIPLAEELAKQFKVGKDEVAGLVSAGKVGFKDVEIAMKNLTKEGGMFFNLMEEQSKTITGKMSNLGDGLENMFNKIGKSNQDVIGSGLDLTIDLVENYEEVGRVIMDLIAVYGSYKAAVIAMSVAQNLAAASTKGWTAAELVHLEIMKALETAQILLNKAMLKSPYVIVAAAVAGLVFYFYKLITAQTAAEKAQDRVNKRMEHNKKIISDEKDEIKKLIRIIKDEVSTIAEKQGALEKLKKLMPSIFDNMDEEAIKIADEIDLMKKYNSEKAKENRLTQQKLILANKAKIKEEEAIVTGTDSPNGLAANTAATRLIKSQAKERIDGLKAETKIMEDNLKKEIELGERAKFNNATYREKIAIKKQENEDLDARKASLGTSELTSTLRDNIQKTINANEVLIKGYQKKMDEIDNAPLRTRLDISNEIIEVTKKQKALQVKSIKGLSKEEQTKLKEYGKDLKALKTELESFTGEVKPTTKGKVYDPVKVEKENNREIEDATYQSELLKLQYKQVGSEKSLDILKAEQERKLVLLKRQRDDSLAEMEAERVVNKKETGTSYNDEAWKTKIEEYKKVWADTLQTQKDLSTKETTTFLKDKYAKDLQEYSDYLIAYIDKKKEFDDNLKLLKEKGNSEENISEVKAMQDSVLANLDEQMGVKEELVIAMANELVGLGLEEVLSMYNEAAKSLETELSNESIDKNLVARLKAKIVALQKLLANGINADDKNYSKKNLANWQKTVSTLDDIRESTIDAIESFGDMDEATKMLLGSTITIASSTIQMISGIQQLSNFATTSMAMTAEGASEAMIAVEKASVILAIIGAALAIITKIVQVISFSKDNKKEKEIKRLQVQVDSLKKSYDALSKAIDKAYSVDATNLIEQQDQNLRRQKELLQQQIKAEERKKKIDSSKIKAWKDAIYEIDQTLASSEERQIEAINGTGVNNAIESFADAYISAWQAGEDKAASMKDAVRKMIKGAIAELVKSRMSGEVEKFAKYLASAMEDGILTLSETKMLDTIEQAINDKMTSLSNTLDAYVVDNVEPEREVQAQGFAQMSQDSADELNGRFATLQAHTFQITESITALQIASSIQLKHLAGIETNTQSLVRLEKIETDIGLMKNVFEDIYDNGITIKR